MNVTGIYSETFNDKTVSYLYGVINSWMSFFGLSTVSELIDQRKVRILLKYRSNMQENLLCKVCQS